MNVKPQSTVSYIHTTEISSESQITVAVTAAAARSQWQNAEMRNEMGERASVRVIRKHVTKTINKFRLFYVDMRVICLDSSAPVQCVKLRSRFKQEQNEPKPAMKRTLCQPYLFEHIVFFASNLIIQCGVRVRFYFLSILFGFPTFYFPLLFSFSFYFFLSHTYTFFSL